MSETPTTYPASTDIPALVTGQTFSKNSHARLNREAAFLSLCHLRPEYIDRLLTLSPSEWRKLLYWLDVSGLTLYFAERVAELKLQGALPSSVSQRLQQNLSDNRKRISSLLRESAALQAEFQKANVSYAVLKGFSLCPSSVPNLKLRHQLDLDFLVDEISASKAREILEQAGYSMCGAGGRTWEFKKNETPKFSTKNMYKDGFGHSVEIHIEAVEAGRESLLGRREYREIEGVRMPVLAPADLFLIQGMHAFKDVCGSLPRASHLLEFYRHVCSRGDDPQFWSEVHSRAEEDPRSFLGLGVVLQLIEVVMGAEIPSKLAMWTMLGIPVPAQRWIALYGLRCVYGTFPGTKLYLLLQRELEVAGMTFKRPARAVLLPTRLPHAIMPAPADETLRFRAQRYAAQLQFILRRIRFHVVEGLRYAWASYRWREQRNEFSA